MTECPHPHMTADHPGSAGRRLRLRLKWIGRSLFHFRTCALHGIGNGHAGSQNSVRPVLGASTRPLKHNESLPWQRLPRQATCHGNLGSRVTLPGTRRPAASGKKVLQHTCFLTQRRWQTPLPALSLRPAASHYTACTTYTAYFTMLVLLSMVFPPSSAKSTVISLSRTENVAVPKLPGGSSLQMRPSEREPTTSSLLSKRSHLVETSPTKERRGVPLPASKEQARRRPGTFGWMRFITMPYSSGGYISMCEQRRTSERAPLAPLKRCA